MSQQTDSKPPPGERPVLSQSQSDPQSASPSGAFFMNASHFGVHGGAFNHANGDMHNNITTNNDSSTRSDFNNNNTGANRYRGSHNDHRQSGGLRSSSISSTLEVAQLSLIMVDFQTISEGRIIRACSATDPDPDPGLILNAE
ncbi:hypothetical protein C8R42DRAFT_729929 [Lentinula raphanica]|nr:hypothetical protein C8R42DRAFT_729929 [Lentinula raphanica]